jgi:L-alanine-DL-glutamate epimerase-like enolase superfamily enzyme
VHCYGIPGYLRVLNQLLDKGWPRSAFWPHGGHLFAIHMAKALGLGGVEVNPLSLQPFGRPADHARQRKGKIVAPEKPGIGFEQKSERWHLFAQELGRSSRVE